MGKPTQSSPPPPPTFDLERLTKSVLYHALEKIAAKNTDRGVLDAGKEHLVEIDVAAIVDGYRLDLAHDGRLQVGFDGQTSRTSAVKPAHVLALVLARLPKSKRAAAELIETLPDEYRANGNALPEADARLVEQCEKLLEALATKISTPRKGAVSFTHAASA